MRETDVRFVPESEHSGTPVLATEQVEVDGMFGSRFSDSECQGRFGGVIPRHRVEFVPR